MYQGRMMTEVTVLMRKYSRFSNILLNTIWKFCQEFVMQNRGTRVFSNRRLELSLHQDSNDSGFRIVNFTYLHHKTESCWRISSDLIYSRNSLHFMETEGLLPDWQVLATCLYPESDQSSPCPPIPIREDPFKYYHPIYAWVFQVVSNPHISPAKPCLHLSSPIHATFPTYLTLLHLITLIIFCEEYSCHSIVVIETMFTHPNIHKHTWNSSDRKTHN